MDRNLPDGAPEGARPRQTYKKKGTIGQWTSINRSFAPIAEADPGRIITAEELRKHNTIDDCWTVVRGYVYNISDYMHYHPGGAEELLRGAGRDCTELFDEYHPWISERAYMAPNQLIGKYAGEPGSIPKVASLRSLGPGGEVAKFTQATLLSVTVYNYNTKIFKFSCASPVRLGVGQHVKFIGGSGSPVTRPYTPISPITQDQDLEFIIKLYPDGRMSKILKALKVNDKIKFKLCKNKFNLNLPTRRIGMIAGGAGIAPMIQVIQEYLKTKKEIKLNLLFSNVTETDILLKKELDKWAADEPDRFNVVYTLTNPHNEWKGLRSRITQETISAHLPPPGPSTQILICGPVAMTNAMDVICHKMGYTDQMIHLFV